MYLDRLSDEELEWLLNDVQEQFGYDFTRYSPASIKRRINRLFFLDKFDSLHSFRERIRNDPGYINRFIGEITVGVTEMFRDPFFYRLLRQKVIPVLATYPFIRVWHAGCSTGEEVYSMAILLQEAGLLHKSLLYATDINPASLEKAKKGIYPISQLRLFSENYIRSGGNADFSSYYTARYDLAKFSDTLKKRMIVAAHNLVSDGSFNEFQLIICRNVLIYFSHPLQEKVLRLIDGSLERLGFLTLGPREHLRFAALAGRYELLGSNEKIWRKMY